MALLALIIYKRVRIISANCVRVYTIESAYVRTYIYMRMHLYPREFAFVYTQKHKRSFLRAYACVRLHACLRADLIKTQNAQNISTLKRTLDSETFRIYYICYHSSACAFSPSTCASKPQSLRHYCQRLYTYFVVQEREKSRVCSAHKG